jgi:SAM-dependent methyltransferase
VMAQERLTPDAAPVSDRLFHEARYRFAAKSAAGRRILDVACGVGYGSAILANSGARLAIGLDYSDDGLQYASSHYRQERISFVRSDAVRLPFGMGVFDLIVSFETIEHLVDPVGFVEQCVRCLRTDGSFIVSTPNTKALPAGLKHSPFHIKEFSLEELKSLLGQHFREIEVFWQPWPEHAVTGQRAAWLSSDLRGIPGFGVLRGLLPTGARSLIGRMLVWTVKYRATGSVDHAPRPVCSVQSEREAAVYLAVCRGRKLGSTDGAREHG